MSENLQVEKILNMWFAVFSFGEQVKRGMQKAWEDIVEEGEVKSKLARELSTFEASIEESEER